MYKVGLIDDGGQIKEICQNEDGTFTNSHNEILDWVYWLNNPWSNTSFSYLVFPNYENSKEYICQKRIIVYDNIEVVAASRGNSAKEAISNCENFIKDLTEKYYEEAKKDYEKDPNCN